MYSRRALFLACIALGFANVESTKIPSSPTAVLKKRAAPPPMSSSSQRLNSSPITTATTSTTTIRYVGYYIDAD